MSVPMGLICTWNPPIWTIETSFYSLKSALVPIHRQPGKCFLILRRNESFYVFQITFFSNSTPITLVLILDQCRCGRNSSAFTVSETFRDFVDEFASIHEKSQTKTRHKIREAVNQVKSLLGENLGFSLRKTSENILLPSRQIWTLCTFSSIGFSITLPLNHVLHTGQFHLWFPQQKPTIVNNLFGLTIGSTRRQSVAGLN